jgi:hypothetical protein
VIFQWLPHNILHIAKHGVEPLKAEEVVLGASPPYPEESDDEKLRVWGQTLAGRYLQVIYVELEDDEVVLEALDLYDRLAFEAGRA